MEAVEAIVEGFLEGMLQEADDFPSPAPELAGDAAVAGHVVFALFVPELPVGFRAGVALGAAVPKASVDEDGNLLLGKGKVGLSGQRKTPSPAGDLVSFQQDLQCLLVPLVVAAPDKGHHYGSLP